MKKINIFFSLLLFTNVLFAIGKEKPNSVKYVSSKDGLNVRESPTLNTKKIAALIYASEVTVLETGTEETIDGIKGNWVKIKIPKLSWSQKDLSGWVFGGYLSEKLDESYIIRYKKFKELDETYNDYNLKYLIDSPSKVLLVEKKGKEVFRKNISSYCYNNAKEKIYFSSEENYIKGKKVWEMKNRHYSFYVLDLNDFSVTELFQNTTVEGGYGLRISANDKYLCYPESGGELEGTYSSSQYYVSHGVGGIYDLEKKTTVLTKRLTNFYPIGNGYFLGDERNYYSLFDKEFNFVRNINIFELANIYISEEEYFPDFRLIYNNTYPFFFCLSTKDNNYRVIINDNDVICEKIEDCEYATFIEMNNNIFCLLVQNKTLNIYNKDFIKIQSIKYPAIPQNMKMQFIDYENGQLIINIDLIEK